MPAEQIKDTLGNVHHITRQGVKSIIKDPSIMAYPFLAAVFILITLPAVSGVGLEIWHKLAPASLHTPDNRIPHPVRLALGIVTFSYFYSAIVATYFSCAVSAAVLAKLEGHPTGVFHGLRVMFRHFWRISRFAVLSVFFIPLAFVAQWRKLPKGIIGVTGSSVSLHTAQLAPAILYEKSGVFATIRSSVNTLGKMWHEGLVIKISMIALGFLLASLGFLPKLIQDHWFSGDTARWVGWLSTALLVLTGWVVSKVLGAVFMTVIYHNVKTGRGERT